MSDEPIDESPVEEPVPTPEPPPPLISIEEQLAIDAEKQRQLEAENDARIDRDVRRLSRRGFLTAAVATGAGYGAWKLLTGSQRIDSLQWPLRRVLQ